MEKATVMSLLEKYWQAETTIAEEQALATYFQGDKVDPGLQPYSDLFSYFHEEARVSAGPDFGNRILQRLGLPLDEEKAIDATVVVRAENVPAQEAPIVPITRKPFGLGVAAAAAAIVLIVSGLFLLKPPGGSTMPADARLAARTQDTRLAARTQDSRLATRTQPTRAGTAHIADTYDDPQQALAAVRHALLVASINLNQGRREITGAHK